MDCIIIGAGFAGAVFARKLAEAGRRVLVVEKRNHIGGNCYDVRNRHGILEHRYGPHLFHTDNEEVFEFLGRFCQWQEYQHRVLALVDGQKVPLPFNLNTLHQLFPVARAATLEEHLLQVYGFGARVSIQTLMEAEDEDLRRLAHYIYEKIFVNYTAKQWGCSPEEIDAEVLARVPVVISRDDRYFRDRFQAIPREGYTSLFHRLLDHERIHLLLNTDFKDALSFDPDSGETTFFGNGYTGELIYTGMVDELFGNVYGRLPYRALRFAFESLEQPYYQDGAVENYPNEFSFTRITEFKRISGDRSPWTTILREYPRFYDPADEEDAPACYPLFNVESRSRYQRYADLAGRFRHLTLVGRLAEYRYYDMDDIVARVLDLAGKMIG